MEAPLNGTERPGAHRSLDRVVFLFVVLASFALEILVFPGDRISQAIDMATGRIVVAPDQLKNHTASSRRQAVAEYIARKYSRAVDKAERIVEAAWEAATHTDLDPLLILAIAEVESSFNPKAVSRKNAMGLMQIIPRYHRDKLRAAGGDIFDIEPNMLVGAQIVKEYLSIAKGDLRYALLRYNGALRLSSDYPDKVLLAHKNLRQIVQDA